MSHCVEFHHWTRRPQSSGRRCFGNALLAPAFAAEQLPFLGANLQANCDMTARILPALRVCFSLGMCSKYAWTFGSSSLSSSRRLSTLSTNCLWLLSNASYLCSICTCTSDEIASSRSETASALRTPNVRSGAAGRVVAESSTPLPSPPLPSSPSRSSSGSVMARPRGPCCMRATRATASASIFSRRVSFLLMSPDSLWSSLRSVLSTSPSPGPLQLPSDA
mmetsp:Transcript_95560/g.270333  ORF Transcript_95560/g.270333 Transcript_95560/m.270333 type:complete len:221 (+) Transcript_95560:66-728(+)